MDDVERVEFAKRLPPELIWRMAEGNPHSTSDETVKHIIPTPIMKLDKIDIPPTNVIEQPPMKDASP